MGPLFLRGGGAGRPPGAEEHPVPDSPGLPSERGPPTGTPLVGASPSATPPAGQLSPTTPIGTTPVASTPQRPIKRDPYHSPLGPIKLETKQEVKEESGVELPETSPLPMLDPISPTQPWTQGAEMIAGPATSITAEVIDVPDSLNTQLSNSQIQQQVMNIDKACDAMSGTPIKSPPSKRAKEADS